MKRSARQGCTNRARYANQSSEYPTIFFGDFNTAPDERGYSIFKALSQVTDSYAVLHPTDAGETMSLENPYSGKNTKPAAY